MSLCIVIPCYNEANRIPLSDFDKFLKRNLDVTLYFVNDGSSDKTQELLLNFKEKHSSNIEVIQLSKNLGKGNAVRQGMQRALKNKDHDVFAFLDADLSTSLEECSQLSKLIQNKTSFVFGSRIKKMDNTIKRKWFRFLIGRMIATAISNALQLAVYDTQCGCKLFSRKTAELAFERAFISSWLFDVEVFFRLKNHFGIANFKAISSEVPLKNWKDQGDSKIKWTYGFKMWFDLLKIKRAYP